MPSALQAAEMLAAEWDVAADVWSVTSWGELNRDGIAYVAYRPLGGATALYERLSAVARSVGATPQQVALAWLLHRSPVMLPIPGTSSVAHLEENLKAAEILLSDAELKAIEMAAR